MSLKDLERFKFAGTVDRRSWDNRLPDLRRTTGFVMICATLRRTPHTFSSAPRAQFPLCSWWDADQVSVSTLKYSIAHDFVMTWDDLENIGHHTFFYEFWVVPEEHLIGFTGTPVNLKTKQKYMTQFMFGTFKVPATCAAIQVGLSPYATRRATRIVMDSCDVVSHTVSRLEA